MPRHVPELSGVRSLADAQTGIVTAWQMRSIGIQASAISRWSKPGGFLTRVLPGTYYWGSGPLTQAQREAAAMAYTRFNGLLTGVAALAKYGVNYLPAPADQTPVHLLIGDAGGQVSRGFVVLERTVRLPQPDRSFEWPTVPLPRALFDACRHLHRDRRAVRACVLECLQRELVTASEVATEVADGQRRWTANLRGALNDFAAGVVSAPEAEAYDIFTEAGLTELVWNADLFAPDGTFVARPDAYDPTVGLALEVESREYHSDGVQLERTLQRNARLAAHGVLVIGVSPYRLRADPGGIVREIRAAQAALALRPTPQLTVRGHDGRLVHAA